ncbi:MAG TPA: hypothetical protein VKV39_00510 [Candidatus Sulfotelmatobacter sp.]|nr:hypothetical protein [Candidatus Sulfotelmatobacter sp.]
MAWETLRSNDGIYEINWDGLTRIIRSCKRAAAVRAKAETKTERGERDWWALGLRLPDLHTVEVPWDKVAIETTTQTENELRRFYAAARGSMRSQINGLIQMMEQADDDRDAFQDMQAEAQGKTMDNIDSAVSTGEAWVKGLKIVRDASAEFVMVGATYVSGGTATIIFTGVGSGMKAGFVYEDTGKKGQAIATFGTNLVLGLADLKAGKAIEEIGSLSGRIGMTIVWAKAKSVLEVPKGLIEGKNLQQAASSGAVKMVGSTPLTSGIEGLKAVLGKSKGWAIPVEVALNLLQDKAGDALAESGEKKETKGPPAHLPHPHPNHRLMDAVIYDRSVIEQSAVRQIGSFGSGD